MAKLAALRRASDYAWQGAGVRSRAILFLLGIINQVGPQRKLVRSLAYGCVARFADPVGFVRVGVRIGGRRCDVMFRVGDVGDYQTIFECLGGMYQVPSIPIAYVIDGGGNIGLFSVFAAATFSTDKILVVEPDAGNFAVLNENLRSWPGIVRVNAALASTDGVSRFRQSGSNLGSLSRKEEPEDKSARYCDVRTCRLSTLIPPDWDMSATWLKLDIEGAEYEVLRELFANGLRPAAISAELHDYFGNGGPDLIGEMSSLGYTVALFGGDDVGNVCRQIHAERNSDGASIAMSKFGGRLQVLRPKRLE